jgi:hypothetical protein
VITSRHDVSTAGAVVGAIVVASGLVIGHRIVLASRELVKVGRRERPGIRAAEGAFST